MKPRTALILFAIGVVIVLLAVRGGQETTTRPPSTPTVSATTTTAVVLTKSSAMTAGAPRAAVGPLRSSTSVAAGATATIATPPTGELQVHYIDVGQGDSVLVICPQGQVMLIDGGDAGCGVLSYLKKKGIERIDLMVATHPHADHIGGLTDVLRSIPVAEVVTNGASHTTRTFERFLDGIAAAGALYTEVECGEQLRLGDLTLDVLNPKSCKGDLNEGSLVLRLCFGEVAFLFMGDAGAEAERRILSDRKDVRSQILKVGHHGSRSASSSSFLSAVEPEVAVYMCGAGNSYGHPHGEALANLAETGADIYGTDVNGTLVVTSDGNTYRVDAEQGQARAPPSPATTVVAAASSPLSIDVVSLSSPISPGSTAKLTVQAAPGAHCAITVHYKSGPSKAAGLGAQTADGSGSVTWRWKVGTRTTPGVWSITVTAESGGQREMIDIPLEVR